MLNLRFKPFLPVSRPQQAAAGGAVVLPAGDAVEMAFVADVACVMMTEGIEVLQKCFSGETLQLFRQLLQFEEVVMKL